MASMHGYPRSAFFRCGLGMEGVKNSFSVKSYGKYEIGGWIFLRLEHGHIEVAGRILRISTPVIFSLRARRCTVLLKLWLLL